jgi:folate-binding protein YgfZ
MYRLVAKADLKQEVDTELLRLGYQRSTFERYDEYRIQHGIPVSPNELSVAYNPLEADLGGLISWTKGCYIGQEVIARLDTYKKVQKMLVGLEMAELPLALPTVLFFNEMECGTITSARRASETGKTIGLGYLKTGMNQDGNGFYFSLEGRKIPVVVDLHSP